MASSNIGTGGSTDQQGQNDTENDDHREVEEDDATLLAQLDDDFELSGMRERRLEELRKQVAKKQEMSQDDHGRYVELKEEKKLIDITAKAKSSVVHFFHPDFQACKTMDHHLQVLATKYFSTRFIRVDVANVPWLVAKLQIQILPCVVGFIDGVSKDRIVGFEGIMGQTSKEIDLLALENRLRRANLVHDQLDSRPAHAHHHRPRIGSAIRQDSDGDSSGWDD